MGAANLTDGNKGIFVDVLCGGGRRGGGDGEIWGMANVCQIMLF